MSPGVWDANTATLKALKRVKAQVCQSSPLQVEEMRADKGCVTTSNTREEGNYKSKRWYERERGKGRCGAHTEGLR